MLAGFPTHGGDDSGAAFVLELDALSGSGGAAPSLAVAGALSDEEGIRLGTRVGAADLDGDGARDLLAAHDDAVVVVSGDLSTSVELSTLGAAELPIAAVTWIATGDLDGDGLDDVVLIAGGALRVVAAADAWTGDATASAEIADAAEAFVADLDRDGQMDLLWTASDGTLGLAYGPLSGTVSADAWLTADAEHVAAADIDGDGAPDVALSTSDNDVVVVSGVVE